ncbi:MAG: hypothetical protein PHX13_12275 [Thiovulaceae bacterium]|nr:hypothetical protein [Sulfurimonadaceae bacterium]
MSFIPKKNKDYINFVDKDGFTEYYGHGFKYVPCPQIVDEQYVLYYKTFYKSGNRYFLGIQNESFVRLISASDFKRFKIIADEKTRVLKDFLIGSQFKNPVQALLPHLD